MGCKLRTIRSEDLELVRGWRMLPEVTKYMYSDPQITPEGQRAWFERVSRSPSDLVWIIELTEGAIPVGLLSLSDIDPVHLRACWGYYIASPEARGKGLAKVLELNIYRHVFEVMEFNRLWCEVLSFNDRVVALHERFGSKVEGVLRQHIIKHGEKFDVVRMAMLAENWPAIRAQYQFSPIEIE